MKSFIRGKCAVVKIFLYISIVLAILFGFYKMFTGDDKGVGYASFVFAVLVFFLTFVPINKEDIDQSQSANINKEYDEKEEPESQDNNIGFETQNESNEDNMINSEGEKYTDEVTVMDDQAQSKMIYLEDFDYFSSSNSSGNAFRYYESVKDNLGFTYANGIGGIGQGENWQEYKLAGKYKEIHGRIVLNYDYRSRTNDDVLLKIYGDNMLLYMSPTMLAGQEPVDFNIDISDIDILKVSIVGENMVRLVDGVLYTSDNNESKEYQQNNENRKTVSLYLLDYFNSSNTSGASFSYYSSVKDNMNNMYADGIGGNSGDLNWQEYKIYGNYKSIQGKIVLNYDYKEKNSNETYVNIYGDSKLLYTSPLITAGQEPVEFNINIEGIDILKISIEGKNMIRIVDCHLLAIE